MEKAYQNPVSSIITSQKRINYLIAFLRRRKKKLRGILILDLILLFICFPNIISWVPLIGYMAKVTNAFLSNLLMPAFTGSLPAIQMFFVNAFGYLTDSALFMIIFNVIVWGVPALYILFSLILFILKQYNKFNSSTRSDLLGGRNDLLSKKEAETANKKIEELKEIGKNHGLKKVNYLRIQKFIDDLDEARYDRYIDLSKSYENSIYDNSSGRETKVFFRDNRVFLRLAPGHEIDLEAGRPFLLYRIGSDNKAMVAYAVTWIQ